MDERKGNGVIIHPSIVGHVVREIIRQTIVVLNPMAIKTTPLLRIEWGDRLSFVKSLNDEKERKLQLVTILK